MLNSVPSLACHFFLTHLHGCHNYHTKEYHSDTVHRASRRCSFMNPSDSNWLALLHKTCSCLSVYYDSVVSSFAERLLSLGLEDRRKDYRGNHVLLDKIPTWANHDSNTGKSRRLADLCFSTIGRLGKAVWILFVLWSRNYTSLLSSPHAFTIVNCLCYQSVRFFFEAKCLFCLARMH